jgi:hypothetical protein
MESEKLEERVNKLEAENRRLQSQMASYVPAVSVLNDCITSLEMQTLVHAKPHSHDYKESKVLLLLTYNLWYATATTILFLSLFRGLGRKQM